MSRAITASDKEWRARMDAETLAEANVIEGDKTRLTAAKQKAGTMAEDKQEEASAMKQVVGNKGSSGGSSSSSRNTSPPKRPMTPKAAGSSLTAGIPGIGKRR
jgi:hypothetical protein